MLTSNWMCYRGYVAASVLVLAGLGAIQPISAESQQGRILAQRWCSTCHAISPEQSVVKADVPSFMAIARNHGKNIHELDGFLAHPHPPMPDMNLSRQEIRDIVDFIASLR